MSTSRALAVLAVPLCFCLTAVGTPPPEQATQKSGKSGKGKKPAPPPPPQPRPPRAVEAYDWQWQVLAAVRSAATEADAEAALLGNVSADVAPAPRADGDMFVEVDRLIRRSWWAAARAAVVRGHRQKMDLTAPVRRAVADVKQEAEELSRWLDPSYAHPASTPMAVRWAQNSSAILLAARFATKWEAPGANLAVFSTEKGQGHVDKARTAENVKQLLRVNITDRGVDAEILAKAQNSRKRFTLSLQLFDEVVSSRSSWVVEFRKAQGSMQMSRGAEIPELHFEVRKRWPSAKQWPRLTASDTEEVVALWSEAPLDEHLGQSEPRSASPLTCAAAGSLYCHFSDSCVATCSDCEGFATQTGRRCTGPLEKFLAAAPKEQVPAWEEHDMACFGGVGGKTLDMFVIGDEGHPSSVGGPQAKRTVEECKSLCAAHLDCKGVVSDGSLCYAVQDIDLPRCRKNGSLRTYIAEAPDILSELWGAAFLDEDVTPGRIHGSVSWYRQEALLQAEAFALCWARLRSGGGEQDSWRSLEPIEALPLVWGHQLAELRPSLQIPPGTTWRGDSSHLLLVALPTVPDSEASASTVCFSSSAVAFAGARLLDRWSPTVSGASFSSFQDEDYRAGRILGKVKLHLPKVDGDRAALHYELYWRRFGDPPELLLATAQLPANPETRDVVVFEVANMSAGDAGPTAVRMPRSTRDMVAYAFGPGRTRSPEPIAALEFQDLRPPTAAPTALSVTEYEQREGHPGLVSFNVSFETGACKEGSLVTPCDRGSSFVLYWLDEHHSKLGDAILIVPWQANAPWRHEVHVEVQQPAVAGGLTVISANKYGEMHRGPISRIRDFSEKEDSDVERSDDVEENDGDREEEDGADR